MPNYTNLPEAPPDQIMQAGTEWETLARTHPDPINTTIGVLLNEETGHPWRPAAIETALQWAIRGIEVDQNYGYQRQRGNDSFLHGMTDLVFGETVSAELEGEVLGYQALGGTGALVLANDVLSQLLMADSAKRHRPTLILDAGWPNHQAIFGSRFKIASHERSSDRSNNHQLMTELIEAAPAQSVVLLQACGYNDDGMDRSRHHWDELLELIVDKDLPLIIDSAYLGLAQGLTADRYAIEQSTRLGILTFVTASASKNMGLYNERIGALFVANAKERLGEDQFSHLRQAVDRAVRRIYSSPPLIGAKAAAMVLAHKKLRGEYLEELAGQQISLRDRRSRLAGELGEDYEFVDMGRGLFAKVAAEGFTGQQRDYLKNLGILVLPSARLNIGGIPSDRIARVGQGIIEALSEAE